MIHRAFGKPSLKTFIPQPAEPLELDACYRYCESMARSRHHNFPVASFFMPSRLRPHIWAIYAFARCADDFADEPEYSGRRALELDRWEEQLYDCFYGAKPTHPVFVALADTAARFELPITPFANLIAGFRTDLEARRYATFGELRGYTALSAEPVGQLFLYLAGHREPELLRYAEDLSTGLALANFWQDLSVDLGRGRVYVPTEDLLYYGLSADDLADPRMAARTKALVRYLVSRTRALFERARPIVGGVCDEIAVEMALIWLGGMRILDKIHAAGDGVLSVPPRLSNVDKAQVVTRALAWRGGSLARRLSS
jgi:squalene synthase HpnC